MIFDTETIESFSFNDCIPIPVAGLPCLEIFPAFCLVTTP